MAPPDSNPASSQVRHRAAKAPLSYVEGGLLVYTAADRLNRGHCCGSGRRHRPYEPRHLAGNTKAHP